MCVPIVILWVVSFTRRINYHGTRSSERWLISFCVSTHAVVLTWQLIQPADVQACPSWKVSATTWIVSSITCKRIRCCLDNFMVEQRKCKLQKAGGLFNPQHPFSQLRMALVLCLANSKCPQLHTLVFQSHYFGLTTYRDIYLEKSSLQRCDVLQCRQFR